MRVHEAADGDAAVEWLGEHEPDLVVLDVMLPGVDGLTHAAPAPSRRRHAR